MNIGFWNTFLWLWVRSARADGHYAPVLLGVLVKAGTARSGTLGRIRCRQSGWCCLDVVRRLDSATPLFHGQFEAVGALAWLEWWRKRLTVTVAATMMVVGESDDGENSRTNGVRP